MSLSEGLQKLDLHAKIGATRRRRPSTFVPESQSVPKNKKVKYHIDLTYSDSE